MTEFPYKCEACGEESPVYMNPRCHPGAPVFCLLSGDVLTIECAKCRRLVCELRVMPDTTMSEGRRRMHNELAEYLGDGLYCDFDGWHIVLYASNGTVTTNTVYLAPDVLQAFESYVKRLCERIKKESTTNG